MRNNYCANTALDGNDLDGNDVCSNEIVLCNFIATVDKNIMLFNVRATNPGVF